MLKDKLTSKEKEQIKKTIASIEPEYKALFLSAFIERLAEKDPNIYKNIFNSTHERLKNTKNFHELETLIDISFSERDKKTAMDLFEKNRKERLKKVFDSSLKKARIVSNIFKPDEKVR